MYRLAHIRLLSECSFIIRLLFRCSEEEYSSYFIKYKTDTNIIDMDLEAKYKILERNYRINKLLDI